jgi:hypothetical protein
LKGISQLRCPMIWAKLPGGAWPSFQARDEPRSTSWCPMQCTFSANSRIVHDLDLWAFLECLPRPMWWVSFRVLLTHGRAPHDLLMVSPRASIRSFAIAVTLFPEMITVFRALPELQDSGPCALEPHALLLERVQKFRRHD